MINQRLVAISLILLRQDDYITISEIAKKIDVSNRTVRNDLKLLEPWITDSKLTLIKKTGMGIKIQGEQKLKLKAYDSLKNKNLNPYPNGPEERVNYMALKLSTTESSRIHEFAEDLFVSRASIHKDLISLKTLLNEYHLDFSRDSAKGIVLEGKERDIRNMMFDVMVEDNKYRDFLELCRNRSYDCKGDFLFYGLDLTDDEIKSFLENLAGMSADNFKVFDINSLSQIVIRFLISFVRVSRHKTIKLSQDFKEKLAKQDFYNEVDSLVKNIEEAYKIKYSSDEVHYLQLFFLSYLQPSDVFAFNQKEVEEFTDYLIDFWSKELKIDLHKDKILIDNLHKHLIPVYTRVKHNIPVENKLIDEIKLMYPNTLEIVKNSIIDSKEWFNMREEDAGFLALHLATALERQKQPLNCLMIHSDGIGAQMLNRQKIERLKNEIRIVKEVNFNHIKDIDYDGIDLIFSTIDLELDKEIPFILVNNIISDDELALLKDIVDSYYKEKNNPKKVD